MTQQCKEYAKEQACGTGLPGCVVVLECLCQPAPKK
jgi:hypothetical protein